MESVVATVSGYHGSDRFNLIKMISQTGASFVGNMNQSTTHLVCWKFEGKKYNLAKKFKIAIVNHRWIEECVKERRRVSESPYTNKCGEEVGTPCLYMSLEFNKTTQSKPWRIYTEPALETQQEVISDDTHSLVVLNDVCTNTITELRQNNHSSINSNGKQKTIKNFLKSDFSGRSCYHKAGTSSPMDNESINSETPYHRGMRKRNFPSELPHGGRILVKKNAAIKHSEMEQECHEVKTLPQSNRNNRILSDMSYSSTIQRNKNDAHGYSENVTGYIQNVTPLQETSKKISEDNSESFNQIDSCNRAPISTELSCVICFTDFSSIRGILPCGHRFCFSCIQNWADQMSSMKKPSTCPLCKASFVCITKVEDAASADQKVYSQNMPGDGSKESIYILPDEAVGLPAFPSSVQVCFRCSNREPEDLLVSCHCCQIRYVHSYCLDPPLFPWTCAHCSDLQMLYRHNRSYT